MLENEEGLAWNIHLLQSLSKQHRWLVNRFLFFFVFVSVNEHWNEVSYTCEVECSKVHSNGQFRLQIVVHLHCLKWIDMRVLLVFTWTVRSDGEKAQIKGTVFLPCSQEINENPCAVLFCFSFVCYQRV
jgi:hypothetical protein